MRVSSLSNDQVIQLISTYFIPVWYSRDSYQLGERDPAEQREMSRIDRAAGDKGGSVCVFLLDPDGSLLATQMVQQASKPENLVPLLKRIIEDKQLKPRDPKAVEASAAGLRTAPRPRDKDGRILKIWTRFDGNRADYGLSRDWVELSPAEAAAFAPPADAKAGTRWNVPDAVADQIYRYFYPPGPNWSVRGSEVADRSLMATVASIAGDEIRIDLRGSLKLHFSFGDSKDTPGEVTAKVVGSARYDRKQRALTSLELLTEDAVYVWHYQGKALPERMTAAAQLETNASRDR